MYDNLELFARFSTFIYKEGEELGERIHVYWNILVNSVNLEAIRMKKLFKVIRIDM